MDKIAIVAYAAGIIDGEGSIMIWMNKRKHIRGQFNIRVNFTSVDKCLVDWFLEHFGGSFYTMNSPSRIKHIQRKIGYCWYCSQKKIIEFLESIYPYLVIKKERCKLAIEFKKTFQRKEQPLSKETYSIRLSFYETFKLINHRGT